MCVSWGNATNGNSRQLFLTKQAICCRKVLTWDTQERNSSETTKRSVAERRDSVAWIYCELSESRGRSSRLWLLEQKKEEVRTRLESKSTDSRACRAFFECLEKLRRKYKDLRKQCRNKIQRKQCDGLLYVLDITLRREKPLYQQANRICLMHSICVGFTSFAVRVHNCVCPSLTNRERTKCGFVWPKVVSEIILVLSH